MEDKKNNKNNTIVIKDTNYNRLDLYYNNNNLILTNLKHFNAERLVFSNPIMFKLPSKLPSAPSNITFNRIFVAITGPKPRKIENIKQSFYDFNELVDFDSQIGLAEKNKTDLEKLLETLKVDSVEQICSTVGDGNYQILIDYDWYKFNIDSDLAEQPFLYNINPNLYQDLPDYNDEILQKFMVFNATDLCRENPNLMCDIPVERYTILISKKWFKENLSEKWIKSLDQIKPLIIETREVFSFGLNQNMLDQNKCSYQISLCLYDRNNPSVDEIKWAAKYEELAVACRKHLKESPFQNKFRGQIDSMKGLTWTEGEVGHTDGPKLYPKILFVEDENGKGKFKTIFTEQRTKLPTEKKEEGDEIVMVDGKPTKVNYTTIDDPLTIAKKYGRFIASLKVESIFIGSKLALQVKVHDVLVVKWSQPHVAKSMIKRSGGWALKATSQWKKPNNKSESEFSDDDDDDDDDEEKVAASKVVRTVKTVNI